MGRAGEILDPLGCVRIFLAVSAPRSQISHARVAISLRPQGLKGGPGLGNRPSASVEWGREVCLPTPPAKCSSVTTTPASVSFLCSA